MSTNQIKSAPEGVSSEVLLPDFRKALSVFLKDHPAASGKITEVFQRFFQRQDK